MGSASTDRAGVADRSAAAAAAGRHRSQGNTVILHRVVHGLDRPMGWVGSGWVDIFQFLVGSVGSVS